MARYPFASPEILKSLVTHQKGGQAAGIYSLCTSHRQVLEASLRFAQKISSVLLVETTCNQVNQFGGYTGLTPKTFTEYLAQLAGQARFPLNRLLVGGDHLGPYPWKSESAGSALAKSAGMVRAYIANGYRKIHLDTSVPCADDPDGVVDPRTAALRAVELCQVAEQEALFQPEAPLPVYVIGTEVPTPGGAGMITETVQITDPQSAAETLFLLEQAFKKARMEEAWERVIALVVQPGVEFSDKAIIPYDRNLTKQLVAFIRQLPGIIFEAHSTDYQLPSVLRQMVIDQFAILKVGPALTFAFREAVFALERIEQERFSGWKGRRLSRLRATMLHLMQQKPEHWRQHYQGSESEVALKLVFSYSDRIRYYWDQPEAQVALSILIENLLEHPPSLVLLSQYLPRQYLKVREGLLAADPQAWVWDYVQDVLQSYHSVCKA